MKVGNKVALKLDAELTPLNVSTPRGANTTKFYQGSEFTLVAIDGEKATVKDTNGNFWQVLLEFIGLVTEATQVNQNTTIGEGASLIKRFIGWVVARFKKKK